MATLTVTPAEVHEGDNVVISGEGFLPATVALLEIPEYGASSEILTDGSGAFSNNDLADRAFTTLTSSGVNVTADDQVVIGAVTYVFKATVTTTANEVKIGADAAATLANLKKAVNLTGVGATDYGSATVIHPTVTAGEITATTLKLWAKTGGTAGNSLASTETAATLSFTSTVFAGGSAASGISALVFTPTDERPFTVKAGDGTNTAQATVQVWTG